MKRIDSVEVWHTGPQGHRQFMGQLARNSRGAIGFTMEAEFLETGWRLSPFFLPQGEGPFVPRFEAGQERAFHGLFGLFADSLPDAFGMAVARRSVAQAGCEAGALELLSYIGEGGRGCLAYKPSLPEGDTEAEGLEEMFKAARSVAEGLEIDWANPLAHAMGTAGGTRPKVHCERFADGTFRVRRSPAKAGESVACIVKFDCTGEFAGRIDHETKIEASYLEMARDCGLRVPEFELVGREGRDHLVLQRFDRTREGALHLHSFWGLAHASAGSRMHDYEFLHRAVLRLTGDAQELAECFGRMAFNILACNQDDHSKQHAFLFNGTAWKLAPAFDLTFSPNPTLGHAMTVSGNSSPSHKDLLAFARKMDVQNGRDILERIQTVTSSAKSYLAKNQVPEPLASRVVEGISRKRKELWGKC